MVYYFVGKMKLKIHSLNTIIKDYQMGPIEGANSKIKTILKSGNGYPHYNRLRNRIMFTLNKAIPYNGNPKRKLNLKFNRNKNVYWQKSTL